MFREDLVFVIGKTKCARCSLLLLFDDKLGLRINTAHYEPLLFLRHPCLDLFDLELLSVALRNLTHLYKLEQMVYLFNLICRLVIGI